jgi:3'-phosphoadenosine 5'-phosphosulfate sulfotransferase (PAPS reductase)/FAD synthetase
LTELVRWSRDDPAMSDVLFPAGGEARTTSLLEDAYAVLDEAERLHKPVARYALFSGGHDSLTTTAVAFAWAEERGLPMAAAHINTGIGIPETTQFVRETCENHGWYLKEFSPPVPYEEIVLEYGFPGPANHGLMYQRLKERCLRQLVREAKAELGTGSPSDRVMLVTGVRSEESQRRMRHVERIQRDGAQVWAAALWNWTKLDCSREMERRELKRNEVVDAIHMSGECLCGAFARPGEIKELEMWYPATAARLHDLERQVEAKGLRGCIWGQRPPRVHREQMKLLLDDYETATVGPLCIGCGPDEEQEAA